MKVIRDNIRFFLLPKRRDVNLVSWMGFMFIDPPKFIWRPIYIKGHGVCWAWFHFGNDDCRKVKK